MCPVIGLQSTHAELARNSPIGFRVILLTVGRFGLIGVLPAKGRGVSVGRSRPPTGGTAATGGGLAHETAHRAGISDVGRPGHADRRGPGQARHPNLPRASGRIHLHRRHPLHRQRARACLDANGDPIPPYHITGTFTGTVTVVPQDPSLPTFTGHFATWFGENSNQKTFNDTDTFTVILTGSDGSTLKFHETAHITVNANGEVTVEFDKPSCF
jgi:hypothetical protein